MRATDSAIRCAHRYTASVTVTTEPNPYSAPQSNLTQADSTDLASRWLRLGGSILDAIAVMIITVPTMYVGGYWQAAMSGTPPDLPLQLAWAAFGFAVFLLVHGYFLYSKGQTLAKRLLDMKIVDLQGGKPPFARLVALRYLVPQLIYLVPILGPIVALVGIALVFRADHRCLHDHLAGTRVVMVK